MSFLSLSQAALGKGVPVLCYHQVRPGSGMSPDKFGRHLDLLTRLGLKTIGLDCLLRVMQGAEPLAYPSVILTFDDCTLDNWVYALPELVRRRMQGVFFAITDFLGTGPARPRSDQGGGASIPDFPDIMRSALAGNCEWFMNHEELRAAVHDFGMEVYSHSAAHQACFVDEKPTGRLRNGKHWSHQALCGPGAAPDHPVHDVGSAYAHSGFGQDWLGRHLGIGSPDERAAFCLNDFTRSKSALEVILERDCPFLCLPWGHYDGVTLEAAKRAGYSGVLNLEAGYVGLGGDPMRLGRLAVKDRKSPSWLGIKISLLAHRLTAPLVRGTPPRRTA